MNMYTPLFMMHVCGPVTIELSQHAFNQDEYRVVLRENGQGEIRREAFNNPREAIRCYLGMIADEHDDIAPNEISAMVNR